MFRKIIFFNLKVTRLLMWRCLITGHCVGIRAAQGATKCTCSSGRAELCCGKEPRAWNERVGSRPALALTNCGHLVAQTLQSVSSPEGHKISVSNPEGILRWNLWACFVNLKVLHPCERLHSPFIIRRLNLRWRLRRICELCWEKHTIWFSYPNIPGR